VCLDDDATIWDVFTAELIVGRAARDEFHERDRAQMRARGPLHLVVGDPLVSVHGDVAWARYIVEFRYEPPGAAEGRVRCTDVLIRRPHGWRIVHHHEGLSP
jgi:ketosteroid isomerase-like protein